jgi:hypothetical protein
MGENFFLAPPMAVLKYHNFLQIKATYEIKEIFRCNISFFPVGVITDKVIMVARSTDFLYNGDESDVVMMVEYNILMDTISKTESKKFLTGFEKSVSWSLQTKEA